jgi:hypothetical protein
MHRSGIQRGSCIFTDFVVLDMQDDAEMLLILGRSFLSDVKAGINVGNVTIRFRIGKNLMFRFRITEEQCYSVQGNDEQIGEWVEAQPQLKQTLTAPRKSKKTQKVWWEVQKSHPSTSQEWGEEWN